MDLFIQPSVEFEKTSSEVTLPEDPNSWPTEVLQELFKQVPYVADFEPHVEMDRVDAERGFAFGHVAVMNKTEVQHGASVQGLDAAGVRTARIPIIVRDRKLQPFDVLITEANEMVPLTENRLRAAIFRPSAFDITGRTPGDQSLVGQLYPPYRQNYGMGGGGGMTMPKEASILSAILPTVTEKDYNEFFDRFQDRGLQSAFMKNGHATVASMQALSGYQPQGTSKTAQILFDMVVPSVVQISRTEEGYKLKTANHRVWAENTRTCDRGEIVRVFGEKIAFDTDVNGSVTMSQGAEAMTGPEADRYELVKDFGMYKVRDEEDRELVGYVFPNLLDTDGTPLPLALFTNGSQAAVQGEIVGVRAGEGASLMEGHPRGKGVFYRVLPNGKAEATIPLTISASLSPEPGKGVVLSGETYDARPVQVIVSDHVSRVLSEGDTMMVPESMCWLSLDSAEDVSLVGDADAANAMAKSASAPLDRTVLIRCGGADSYSLSGLPIEKIASSDRSFLSFDDALFYLVGMGAHPVHATEKLSHARFASMPVAVHTGREITLMSEAIEEAQKVAAAKISKLPNLRKDLVKEAAVIPDPVAVDTVLSLGFLNPENMHHFVSYLPTIDESQKHLCELLVASRLGLRDIPAPALERAIRSTEEVLEGLKVLALQSDDEAA